MNLNDNPFYLESVYSFSRGQTEAVISQLVDTSTIRCVSTDLKCLMLNLPPEGYGYALIDKDANVLFSSKKTRNNFRNLSSDVSDDGFIQRGILAETPQTGQFEYGKDRFNGNISPVYAIHKGNSYPLYLLTYADMKLLEWQTGVSTILTGVAAGIVPLCFVFLIFLWRFTKAGKLKSNAFEDSHSFHFLFPDASKMPEYIVLSLISLIYIGMLHFAYASSELRVILAAIASTIIMYAMIRVLLLVNHSAASSTAKGFYYFFGFLGLLVFILSICQKQDVVGISILLGLNIVLFIGAIIFKKLNKWSSCHYHASKTLYTVSMFLWLLAAVVSPVIVISSWSEGVVESSLKRMVYDLYEVKAESMNDQLSQNYSQYVSEKEWRTDTKIDYSLNRLIDFSSADLLPVKAEGGYVAPIFNHITSLFESRHKWQPIFSILSDYKKEKMPGDYLPAVFVFLFLLYLLIHSFVKRLFFNVPSVIPSQHFEYESIVDAVEKYTNWLQLNGKPIRLFLVGLPRSRREELIKRVFEHLKKIEYIDFQWFQNSINDPDDGDSMLKRIERADMIVVDHWYPCELSDEYSMKLKFLTCYLNDIKAKDKNIIMLSNFTITQMEQNWDNFKATDADEKRVKCIISEFSSWIHSFREFVVPIESSTFDESIAVTRMGMKDVTSYLNKSYYSPAYSGIWNALTQSERFILYDLSDDNLLNTHDRNTLLKLYLKGLIVNNERQYKLDPFQMSFRLFVKYGVSPDELYEIESLSAKNGSWRTFRLGLYLLILALLIFSYRLNPGALKGFGTIVGGVVSVVGVLSQLSGKINFQGLSGIFKKSV